MHRLILGLYPLLMLIHCSSSAWGWACKGRGTTQQDDLQHWCKNWQV